MGHHQFPFKRVCRSPLFLFKKFKTFWGSLKHYADVTYENMFDRQQLVELEVKRLVGSFSEKEDV